MESKERRRDEPEEFVTVVNVAATAESFVTVLSIGNGKRSAEENGIDPAHPEEEVEVYRLPGERLGFGLKFDGGNKTSEKVRRLFIQSCADQSPASRAKCSWGNLGEGDEVLSIDDVPVSQMTRLDCVRRLKESQLVIKLRVRYRGALRPEVVSAERKLSGYQLKQEQQQLNKVLPELPAAPPPVPPRKLRHSSQTANNRGLADGEASPGAKKIWDNSKSIESSQSGSPQSQGSFRSAASSVRSSTYESCTSSPVKSYPGSKNDSPKDSPKVHVSPVLNKTKQEQPPEAQSYLDARSQDGSSTHDSTSDDTSSTLSTVIDRFSSSDRFSTTSTASTTSEQPIVHPDVTPKGLETSTDLFLTNGIIGLSNPDFLLTRLANSEARTFVESRGDVELITAVVAPNTVVIEETPTLQPPLSFQDAPLSYGHEPRPGIFYSADLAADSKTHFRPIKDDAELVDKVFNGEPKEAPPLPVRNHINRIPINQQESHASEANSSNTSIVPPKPMPRKDLKAKRKRPPPPPPPPRRETLSSVPVPETRCLNNAFERKKEEIEEKESTVENNNDVIGKKESETVKMKDSLSSEVIDVKSKEFIINDENANEQIEKLEVDYNTNKVLEIVEMKKMKALAAHKDSSGISDECEVPEREANAFITVDDAQKSYALDVELKNSINRKLLTDTSTTSTISIELDSYSDNQMEIAVKEENEKNEMKNIEEIMENDVSSKETKIREVEEDSYEIRKMERYEPNEFDQVDTDSEEDSPLVKAINNDVNNDVDRDEDEDLTDESDGDYYWQSNLATIGEEEENNSLEYENANEDQVTIVNPVDKPQIIENVIENISECLDENARDKQDCMRRITRDARTEDKKQDKTAVNGRMDNCGGGGQRLPPDGDEFPAAYQEFTNPNQPYQYVTKRETVAANGDVDRGESVVDGTNFVPAEKAILVAKSLGITDQSRAAIEVSAKKERPEAKKPGLLLNMDADNKTLVNNCILYSMQKTFVSPSLVNEKKIEIAGYYPKETCLKSLDVGDSEVNNGPPPLPLTGPPKINDNQDRKFASNGELWRQDNKSEKSVKDKIAMFSSQSSLEAPLFPTTIATVTSCSASSNVSSRRLSKHKSSDDVFADDRRSPLLGERTQSSFDLSLNNHHHNHHRNSPNLPQTSPPTSPRNFNGYSSNGLNNKYSTINSNSSSYSGSPLNSYATSYNGGSISPQLDQNKSFDGTLCSPTKVSNGLMRAMSFSGSSNPYNHDKFQSSNDSLMSSTTISRTNSLASTFKRPSDDMRKSSLNQLIEQRRKGISKLRGLVIPEKDAVAVDQPIIDLPEIKSRDSILNNQVPRSNIQDKWGSQSSLVSNASTVSSSMRTSNTFKMPVPKILSNYSPAFKRKSLTVYGNSQPNNSPIINNSKNNMNNQLTSPDAPKSLESICSPTRSDYSFDFVSSSGSPDNNLPILKPKLSSQRKIGRNEYDDSDNDSAVSSSQSSISRGFSPPMSPVPSDRSTMSSERSYLSETHYQRPQLILDNSNKTNGTTILSEKNVYSVNNGRSNLMVERSTYSLPDKSLNSKLIHHQQQQQHVIEPIRSSHIPQRQPLRRSSSNETNLSNSSSSTLTSGSQASVESLSRRVLKPQSVEAINRKNILASARCRSGRDLNGSPLIQRKFADEEEAAAAGENLHQMNGGFVNPHREMNGSADCAKPQIKIAYIEITDNVVMDADKFSNKKKQQEQQQQQPRLPPKRSIIPQAKNVPLPSSRPPKSEMMEPSSDMKSWMRAEMRTLVENGNDRTNSYDPRKKSSLCDMETSSMNNRNAFRSKSTLTLNEYSTTNLGSKNQLIDGEGEVDAIDSIKPKSRSNITMKKTTDNHNDLLTVLTTKSRSRSAIHVEETNYGNSKCQMSLEDMLEASSVTQSDKESLGYVRGLDTWPAEEKLTPSRIPSLNRNSYKTTELGLEEADHARSGIPTKIPTARNLGRRSASVTDMKKAFEKVEPTVASSAAAQLGNSHSRFPSLDSSVEDGIRPVCDREQERFNGEQFGSISSLASSTSLISQQELAQLVEEANLEEPRGGHDVVVVLLHKENPSGSVGITLAGGVDCETKEISIHRVLAHSIADKEGSVQRGDRILSINGRSMRGLTHRESLAVLKQPRPELVLVLSRAKLEDGVLKLRTRTESVETIVEGYETNGLEESSAWGPASMVAMYKDGAGLGFSLEGGRDSPLGDRPLLIKKIFTGGAAEKAGALRAGDQLLEVNKRDVSRMSRIEAWSFMKKLPDGEVTLLVRHPATKSS